MRAANHKEKISQLTTIKYLLEIEKLNNRQIARVLGLSAHTVGRLIKRHNLMPAAEKAMGKAMKNPVKYDESLSAFMAKLRIKHPQVYAIIYPIYHQHLNNLKNN